MWLTGISLVNRLLAKSVKQGKAKNTDGSWARIRVQIGARVLAIVTRKGPFSEEENYKALPPYLSWLANILISANMRHTLSQTANFSDTDFWCGHTNTQIK